ncbi:acrosomal protein SP-10 isoform X2 [Phodopus roborovskii]|uniref:acrosomal protein SP-10 isoform X2 n=1 Tax=Phodopus roborovskii TaxID=109678 RepID=UPI0021E3F75D|nr:acrosomal protein SP-10 isoform X2 [Phodopus roborovskii]
MKELIFLCLYLLGSARGAPPGQPDELDSVDRQASVQQLSSEYFSLANPSDVEALYETPSGEKALTDHSSSEHESSEHTSGGHITGEHITGEHTSGEHTSGEHTSGEPAEQSSEAASETSSAEQVSGEKPEEVEQVASEASGEKNEAMSTPFPSSSSGAAINCHTCAYMNDDGKCLRGEGVCTTQNSQQCMLKKIFEGGKLQFMVQGCENMCPSMNLFSHGTRMQIMCCRNEPLCNKT